MEEFIQDHQAHGALSSSAAGQGQSDWWKTNERVRLEETHRRNICSLTAKVMTKREESLQKG